MSGPWAEDGRLTPLSQAQRDLIAQHEQRLADRKPENEPDEDEVLERLRDGLDEL